MEEAPTPIYVESKKKEILEKKEYLIKNLNE